MADPRVFWTATMPTPLHEYFVSELPQAMIIEIAGSDAGRVLHNLTTNDVTKLAVGEHVETFVTDIRGWTVAHGLVIRLAERILLVGSHPAPARVCDHIERYIIREDARVLDISDNHRLVCIDGSHSAEIPGLTQTSSEPFIANLTVSITSRHSRLLVGLAECFDALGELGQAGRAEFDLRRIRNFWPLMGQDILEKSIPQELDRDAQAISFTKGCYLGQETIARLDARGQLQRKLCLLQFDCPLQASAELTKDGEKVIGSLTSVAVDHDQHTSYALAFLRRGYFSAGTQINCQNAIGTVLENPMASVCR